MISFGVVVVTAVIVGVKISSFYSKQKKLHRIKTKKTLEKWFGLDFLGTKVNKKTLNIAK